MTEEKIYTQDELDIALLNNSQIETRKAIDRMEKFLYKIDKKMDTKFYWLMGVIASADGVMAHGFHWI